MDMLLKVCYRKKKMGKKIGFKKLWIVKNVFVFKVTGIKNMPRKLTVHKLIKEWCQTWSLNKPTQV